MRNNAENGKSPSDKSPSRNRRHNCPCSTALFSCVTGKSLPGLSDLKSCRSSSDTKSNWTSFQLAGSGVLMLGLCVTASTLGVVIIGRSSRRSNAARCARPCVLRTGRDLNQWVCRPSSCATNRATRSHCPASLALPIALASAATTGSTKAIRGLGSTAGDIGSDWISRTDFAGLASV